MTAAAIALRLKSVAPAGLDWRRPAAAAARMPPMAARVEHSMNTET